MIHRPYLLGRFYVKRTLDLEYDQERKNITQIRKSL